MPLFLGIYHKRNRLAASEVQPMVDVFGARPDTYLTRRDFLGFVFVSVNEKEGESVFSDQTAREKIAGLVGTIAINGRVKIAAADNLLQEWEQKGEASWSEMEGAFAAAVYDPKAHRLILANDKFGMRPVFFCETEEYFAFCNELEPLLKTPGFKSEHDTVAIASYFCLGTTLGGQTFVDGIQNMAPANCMVLGNGAVRTTKYWKCDIAVDHATSIEGHAKSIVQVMQTVVPQMAEQLTNVRGLISAGADSRLILSCMQPAQRLQIDWITSHLSILPPSEDKDVIGALAIATRLGLKHQVLPIAFSEADFGPAYFEEARTSRQRKIVGGWHGGEFLGGYCALAAPIKKKLVFAEVDATLRQIFSRRFIRNLQRHPFEAYQIARQALEAENREFQFQIQQFGRAYFSMIYNGSRGNWLQPFEIINQGFSPFWDSRFLQAILRIPFEFLADYRLYNLIFRDFLRELADIPSNSPLTNRIDSCLPRMTIGIDPKIARKPKYQTALNSFEADQQTWHRRIYRRRKMRSSLREGEGVMTMRFLDFEAWMRREGR